MKEIESVRSIPSEMKPIVSGEIPRFGRGRDECGYVSAVDVLRACLKENNLTSCDLSNDYGMPQRIVGYLH